MLRVTLHRTTFDGFLMRSVMLGFGLSSVAPGGGTDPYSLLEAPCSADAPLPPYSPPPPPPYSLLAAVSSWPGVTWGGVRSVSGLGGGAMANMGGGIRSFSWTMRPPRFEVFSTDSAVDIPCPVLPRPCPS